MAKERSLVKAAPADTASRRAMTLIRQGIAEGRFAPLSQLPREIDLAGELGVSRGALREAIRALELVGILESRHGSGTYVTGLTAADIIRSAATDNLHIDATSALELMEFRRVVEPGSIVLAAGSASPEQIREIRAIYEASEQTDDPAVYLELDNDLHRAIVRASGNSILTSVMESVAYGAAWDRMWSLVLRPTIPERTRREHESLVVAIETGDVQLALATAQAHLAAAQRQVRARFDDASEES
ncbi:DNA-binding FadR family transcriptional regulator [Compostimonas suwonensis]|uniref:DNA-binding FadR family transcriptional regulator n=2 Tax=Compostimonas suwonensis TaxID=1048394 RepID=A0A2M9BYS0_9MICO|nr:DNA-binding FadR family transcriptional regulator [Compostimonas suwonensis]